MENIPIFLIFIPIFLGLIIYLIHNKKANYLAFASQILMIVLFIIYYDYFVKLGRLHIFTLGLWNKSIGITLLVDNISIVFIALTIFIWSIIILYSFNKRSHEYKFLFFLLFLEGSFIALLLSNDLFNIFVILDIITILSTILIVYKKDGFAVRAGLYYLAFNSVGILFYLLGLILLYSFTGTLNMDIIKFKIEFFKDTNIIKLSYVLIMAAVGVKSALFPVYNWLPRAHSAAPSGISALLSGLLVKSGLYVFIRMNQMFNMDVLNDFFFLLGFLTGFLGVLFALSQKDIKQILAFHTISQIGIMLMGVSAMEGELLLGGILHIFNHAIFKTLLFLAAGILINRYGTRRVTEIRGVFRDSPILAIFILVGIFSITGAPLFNGYISKSIIKHGLYASSIKVNMLNLLNLGTMISFVKFSQIFFGHSKVDKIPQKKSAISIFILAFTCVFLGLFSKALMDILFDIELSYLQIFDIGYIIDYGINLIIAFIIFKLLIEKDYKVIKKLRHINLSFGATNIMLLSFIVIMIIWIRF
ncbi:MAG: complex I subunit 5 family protein [Senegalia sp. (in: firmicutes)]|uniref:complex I subunit 5 family protein n=1 Tax=Senegalia sp. (in: firmicutes) TaxID=1924098 RepID=UPI003F9B0388